MPRHARIFWGRHIGRTIFNFTWSSIRGDRITGDSVVLISASEGQIPNTTAPNFRFVGDANFTVSNISPRFNAVSFVVNIDWYEPLILYTDITVFDKNEDVVQAGVPFDFPK
jgi:hypothetical protein